MMLERLTCQRVEVRPLLVPLKRPIVSRVGMFDQWPLILIDLHTKEGIVGRAYLEPYLKHAARYIVPAIHDIAKSREGERVCPLDDFQNARRALSLVGYEGVTMIAIAGLDMAAWDALGQAAGMPLATLLGGAVGAVDAYNSNGLWLTEVDGLAEEATALLISKMVQPAQVVAHAMSYPAATMGPPEQEVGHGAEQGAVPARSVDAGILRSVRFAGAV